MVPSTEAALHAPPDPDSRTRVLFVLGSAAGGGAERIVVHLVRHLDRGEFDPRVGLLWRHGEYLDRFSDADLVVPALAQGWIPYRDQPNWWQLLPALALVPLQQREIVTRVRPHIVVTVTKSMNIAARFSLPLAGRRRLTWIAREGNNTGAMIDDESPTGLVRALQTVAVRTAYRGADRVVAISEGVGRALAERFHLDSARVTTIHNAVDVADVRLRARDTPSWLPAQPFVVAAGRLVRQKGFDVLINAFADRFLDRDLSLVILGEGPERGALESVARARAIADRVFLPGFVANPWSYFSRAATFVCSSRWEGFGNVIIEAMASGAPIVATDCDFGPREIVQRGISGLMTPVDDRRSLGGAMAAILDDRQLAAQLSDGARRRAVQFDVGRMVEGYARLFRELRPVRL